MLTPGELNNYPNEVVKLFEELEAFILSDVSRRLHKSFDQYGVEFITPTGAYQLQALDEMNEGYREVKKKLAETEGLALQTVTKLFKDANIKSFEREKTSLKLAGKQLTLSSAKKLIIENSVKNIEQGILSLTGSLGMAGLPLEQAYHHALNTAYMQVSTGTSDYISAIRRQVKALADSGLEIISWESGHTDKADVSVRRAIITGLSLTTQQISMMNAQEMGVDLVEVSAHAGARPSHAEWQGRIYSLSGNHPGYPDFYAVTGYGTGPGLGGYNCRHSFFPFVEGSIPQYTEEQLANIDPPPFKFSVDGKEYTAYDASQKQRSIERAIRKTKREIHAFNAAGLEKDEIAARARLRQERQLYKQFSREAGLLEQKERLGVVFPSDKNAALHANSKSHDVQGENRKHLVEILKKPDYNSIISTLERYEAQIVTQDFETAIVVTKSGEVYRIDGSNSSVDPGIIGEALKSASVTHNHPRNETEFSFSKDDHNMFIQNNLEVLRGIDYKYTYELSRKPSDSLDETDIPASKMNDEYYMHSVSVRKAKEGNYHYTRWENDKRKANK